MAYDKAVDSTALENGLTTIADAIRAKGGTAAPLEFPQGMAEAVAAISGGSSSGPGLISDTTYIHPEDWLTDAKGNAFAFASTYMNGTDLTDRSLYYFFVTGNMAPSQKATRGVFRRLNSKIMEGSYTGASIGTAYRNGSDTEPGQAREYSNGMSYYVSRGSEIRVLRFQAEEAV